MCYNQPIGVKNSVSVEPLSAVCGDRRGFLKGEAMDWWVILLICLAVVAFIVAAVVAHAVYTAWVICKVAQELFGRYL
ncbi:MAG: hypothetical protein A3D44_00195 [Candidatus Staskawiczbacteria bacterium RIFCSPHIGHO2_02_FULL_42_22]|uniref:Uncharacterized protein n=1 Tax=Candidatus Staskawiczbacteria bacterium RIFCSPHIGHO2_02_FULL_42_22 TaxID=1802207 RepID=A0A1G2I2D5_9BACT|nr:MAG: hypothetical protein A3D44_00195 [Candidatus Staskawiczbacteria bacterium RIFCSPHIGHO2_02_FULL_42_22]